MDGLACGNAERRSKAVLRTVEKEKAEQVLEKSFRYNSQLDSADFIESRFFGTGHSDQTRFERLGILQTSQNNAVRQRIQDT